MIDVGRSADNGGTAITAVDLERDAGDDYTSSFQLLH